MIHYLWLALWFCFIDRNAIYCCKHIFKTQTMLVQELKFHFQTETLVKEILIILELDFFEIPFLSHILNIHEKTQTFNSPRLGFEVLF